MNSPVFDSGGDNRDIMTDFPPTVIVVHPKERRSKCSVEPLRGQPGFQFYTFPESVTLPASRYIRLGLGGPELSANDSDSGLLVLDGTWKLAAKMEPEFPDIPLRTLPPIRTAYPRTSKIQADPSDGLATIEAVYAAYRIMNRPCEGLLRDYHWRREFLEANGWA